MARVVASLPDPDPRVNGGGFARLRQAGIAVDVGPGADEAAAIMSGFLHRIRSGQPQRMLLDRPTDAIPDGVDGLLTPRGLVLRGRRLLALDPHRPVWPQLGPLGLTLVAVSP